MFLAKTWKTIRGKRYVSWSLKKGIWDKERKRYKQIYLAYVGKSKKITLEKAQEICTKLGIPLDEMRKVKRLRIVELEEAPSVQVEPIAQIEVKREVAEEPVTRHIPTLIKDLRERYDLEYSVEDYETLAMHIGILVVNASDLRRAELEQLILPPHQQKRIEEAWLLSQRKAGNANP